MLIIKNSIRFIILSFTFRKGWFFNKGRSWNTKGQVLRDKRATFTKQKGRFCNITANRFIFNGFHLSSKRRKSGWLKGKGRIRADAVSDGRTKPADRKVSVVDGRNRASVRRILLPRHRR